MHAPVHCASLCKNVCHASVVIQLFTILFLVAVGLWTVCSFTFTVTILHAEVLIPSIYFIANILMVTFLPITVTSVRLVCYINSGLKCLLTEVTYGATHLLQVVSKQPTTPVSLHRLLNVKPHPIQQARQAVWREWNCQCSHESVFFSTVLYITTRYGGKD